MKVMKYETEEATEAAIYKLLAEKKHFVVTGRKEIRVFEDSER